MGRGVLGRWARLLRWGGLVHSEGPGHTLERAGTGKNEVESAGGAGGGGPTCLRRRSDVVASIEGSITVGLNIAVRGSDSARSTNGAGDCVGCALQRKKDIV